jgi:hypothetical protein
MAQFPKRARIDAIAALTPSSGASPAAAGERFAGRRFSSCGF